MWYEWVLWIFSLCTFLTRIILFVQYEFYDSERCLDLLEHGQWLGSSKEIWAPSGCTLKDYARLPNTHIAQCTVGGRVLFTGDTGAKRLYDTLVTTLGASSQHPSEDRDDTTLFLETARLDFVWDPYLNSTSRSAILESQNAMTVIGAGFWFLKHVMVSDYDKFQSTIRGVVDSLDNSSNEGNVFFLPVSRVNYERIDWEKQQALLPANIAKYNIFLANYMSTRRYFAPSALDAMDITKEGPEDSEGIHTSDFILRAQANLLLNYQCNDALPKTFPSLGTCCLSYPKATYRKYMIPAAVVGIAGFAIRSQSMTDVPSPLTKLGSARPSLLWSVVAGLAVLSMTSLADRTQVFVKHVKEQNMAVFTVMSLLSLLYGFVTPTTTQSSANLINGTQVEEWKGFTMLLLLVYNYCGIWSSLALYGFMRFLVSLNMFSVGFSTTLSFYTNENDKEQRSFKQIALKIIRLNSFVWIICYFMNTNYLLYYFAPLFTFWLIGSWTVMRVYARYNHNLVIVHLKIVLLVCVMVALCSTGGVLEMCVVVLKNVFNVSWDVNELRSRMQLELSTVCAGMVVGVLVSRVQQDVLFSELSGRSKASMVLALIGGLFAFIRLQALSHSKANYDNYHQYLGWIPVATFVVLRNSTPALRRTYSKGFGFIGKMNMELFVLHYHIWNAVDESANLLYFPVSWRIPNIVVATTIFLFLSSQAHRNLEYIESSLITFAEKALDRADSDDQESIELRNVQEVRKAEGNRPTPVAVRILSKALQLVARSVDVSYVVLVVILACMALANLLYRD